MLTGSVRTPNNFAWQTTELSPPPQMDADTVQARLAAVRGNSANSTFDDDELRARLARLQGFTAPPANRLPPRGPASSPGDTELPPRPALPEDEVEELLRAKADEV